MDIVFSLGRNSRLQSTYSSVLSDDNHLKFNAVQALTYIYPAIYTMYTTHLAWRTKILLPHVSTALSLGRLTARMTTQEEQALGGAKSKVFDE